MEYDPNLTVSYLAGVVDKLVKDQGRDTIKRNAKNDPHARYARIPNGNACDFCKMLGSRGFVYHSEATAGDDREYHKKCNCQIAVSFDPFIERYWVGNVHVSRGYADDAELVVPGRDGSHVLRDVDIDELFAQYKSAGNSFNKRSVYKDYSAMPDFMHDPLEYLRSASTEEELRERADEVLRAYKDSYTSKQLEKILPSARNAAQKRLAELENANQSEQGALLGALSDSNDPYYMKRDEHAERYYSSVRNRDKRLEVLEIAKNSGLDESRVSKAYDHLFIDEHDLEKGRARFDPSYDIAQSWQRLRDGKSILPHDLTLLKHEAYEYDLMKSGASYEEAHAKAQARYNYAKELRDYLEGGV